MKSTSTSVSPGVPSQPAWNRSLGGLESLGKTRRANQARAGALDIRAFPTVGAVYDRPQCQNSRSRAVIDRPYSCVPNNQKNSRYDYANDANRSTQRNY